MHIDYYVSRILRSMYRLLVIGSWWLIQLYHDVVVKRRGIRRFSCSAATFHIHQWDNCYLAILFTNGVQISQSSLLLDRF